MKRALSPQNFIIFTGYPSQISNWKFRLRNVANRVLRADNIHTRFILFSRSILHKRDVTMQYSQISVCHRAVVKECYYRSLEQVSVLKFKLLVFFFFFHLFYPSSRVDLRRLYFYGHANMCSHGTIQCEDRRYFSSVFVFAIFRKSISSGSSVPRQRTVVMCGDALSSRCCFLREYSFIRVS